MNDHNFFEILSLDTKFEKKMYRARFFAEIILYVRQKKKTAKIVILKKYFLKNKNRTERFSQMLSIILIFGNKLYKF